MGMLFYRMETFLSTLQQALQIIEIHHCQAQQQTLRRKLKAQKTIIQV